MSADESTSKLLSAYQEHYDSLLATLTSRLSDFHKATEVVHETYLRLVRLKDRSADHIDNPKAYIFKMAQNIAIDGLRRDQTQIRRTVESGLTETIVDDAPSPERVFYDRQRIRLLDDVLGEMPYKQRTALLMARVERCTHAEIAEALGVSESMVAKYLARGLKQCRQKLADLD